MNVKKFEKIKEISTRLSSLSRIVKIDKNKIYSAYSIKFNNFMFIYQDFKRPRIIEIDLSELKIFEWNHTYKSIEQ